MKHKHRYIKLFIFGSFGILMVVFVFLSSEKEVHQNNAFTRRYPHHPITKQYNLDLQYNSYYISGYHEKNLYLGNRTAPLHVLKINLETQDTTHINIRISEKDLPFSAVKVHILSPYFYVMDGRIPIIFRGSIHDWEADVWLKDEVYFMNALPIDSAKLFIRTISSKTNETILGAVENIEDFKLGLNSNLIEKQMDGVFDVDGTMAVSQSGATAGYVYYYRNQYLIMDKNLQLIHKEHTIDTVSVAQLQLATNKNNQVKMSAPPLQINKSAALTDNFVLIQSDRLGKYERKEMLDQAAIIDVYDWQKRTYEFSLYFYNVNGESMREFNLYDDYMVGLTGTWLSVYTTKQEYFKSTNQHNKSIGQ